MVEVDFWTWRMAGEGCDWKVPYANLSAAEHEEANSFLFEKDRHRFSFNRSILKSILSEYTDRPANELHIVRGPWGKPRLLDTGTVPFFNLSHSASLASFAVSWECDLGIDIEAVKPIEKEISKNFSSAEQAALAVLDGEDWLQAFYRCWTRKEAFVKALGAGLNYPLSLFDVSICGDKPAKLLECRDHTIDLGNWTLNGFVPGTGYAGAICICAPEQNAVFRERFLPEQLCA